MEEGRAAALWSPLIKRLHTRREVKAGSYSDLKLTGSLRRDVAGEDMDFSSSCQF